MDLCYACYLKRSVIILFLVVDVEFNGHKAGHRVLVIPEYIDEDDSGTEKDALKDAQYNESDDTDIDGIPLDDLPSRLDSFVPLSTFPQMISDKWKDLREEVSALTDSLRLEVLGSACWKASSLDAMCYFQFDFEGIQRVLSKRVPVDVISDYVFKCLLFFPSTLALFFTTMMQWMPHRLPPLRRLWRRLQWNRATAGRWPCPAGRRR